MRSLTSEIRALGIEEASAERLIHAIGKRRRRVRVGSGALAAFAFLVWMGIFSLGTDALKETILLTGSADTIPFDLRGQNHIVYHNIRELREQLEARLIRILPDAVQG